MIKYKLLTKDMESYGGFKWEVGETAYLNRYSKVSDIASIINIYYDSPRQAVLLNSLSVNQESKLFEVMVDDEVGSCRKVAVLRELNVPVFSVEQRIYFAILCVLEACEDNEYKEWANRWLSGKDRTAKAAKTMAMSGLASNPEKMLVAMAIEEKEVPEVERLVALAANSAMLSASLKGNKIDLEKIIDRIENLNIYN